MSYYISRFVAFLTLLCTIILGADIFRWKPYDNYAYLSKVYRSMPFTDCEVKSKDELMMPQDVVSQIPKFTQLLTKTWYKNRTNLLQLHNMALNRAFFFSFINQKLNSEEEFDHQPGLMYYYMSAAADVNANQNMLNGSSIIFDNDCHYANFLNQLDFNKTIPLFAPSAWRWEDYRDSDNYLREPTKSVVHVEDLGSYANKNYTVDSYKMNEWYQKWLPDIDDRSDSLTKFSYSVGIKYSNVTGEFETKHYNAYTFFGPANPGENQEGKELPVQFTRTYYDCGKSNKWILSATAPIADYMVRYTNWTHLRRPRFVGVISMDIDFKKIDYNSCPVSVGNPGPSFLSGVARCDDITTTCKSLSGFGFKRGNYKCVCKPGYRYPWYIEGPYLGKYYEKSADREILAGFKCSPVQFMDVLPIAESINGSGIVKRYISSGAHKTRKLQSYEGVGEESGPMSYTHESEKYSNGRLSGEKQPVMATKTRRKRMKSRVKRQTYFDQTSYDRMLATFEKAYTINAGNCKDRTADLLMGGDVAYGVDKQFERQARISLRLSHFVSNFLQNINPGEVFGHIRGDRLLHPDIFFGEVASNVMSDFRVLSSGIFFDRDKFVNIDGSRREFFGPWAYQNNGQTLVHDTAGLKTPYVNEDWFVRTKQRWATNLHGLVSYKMRSKVRSDINGTSNVNYDNFPMVYKAPAVEHGFWTHPYFRCDGMVDQWVISYIVPFFGLDYLRKKVEFKGVVTVDIPLLKLDIDQCPQSFTVANAFKGSAMCHYPSTTCSSLEGKGFTSGAYMCSCSQGYEYFHQDGKMWIEGQLLEAELNKKNNGVFSRFDALRCRISGASEVSRSAVLVILAFFISVLLH